MEKNCHFEKSLFLSKLLSAVHNSMPSTFQPIYAYVDKLPLQGIPPSPISNFKVLKTVDFIMVSKISRNLFLLEFSSTFSTEKKKPRFFDTSIRHYLYLNLKFNFPKEILEAQYLEPPRSPTPPIELS